ncbi:probable tRNA methyltransferase 9B [Protopterus annectens]|uniref:probable tRNA methyltransferase 9B n=1 Tax=Protopterus annectens TaxID=7888 RepID=UPI001CF98984|nr:probable tRNA methyltransferase 9B [Protopterus annectens]
MEHEAIQLEHQHVHSVYEKTASYFSDLQSKAWPRVRQFLLEQQPGSLIADIGCGTGKYLDVNNQVFNLGCDYCGPLAEIASKRGHEVMICDNLNLPFRSQCFNAVISVGVIHHFSTRERRIRAIEEMSRVLKPGGQMMIYVWAMEQKNRRFEKQDVFVPWNRALCSRHPSESSQAFNKSKEEHNCTLELNYEKVIHSEINKAIILGKDLSMKYSFNAVNSRLRGQCCLKISEDQKQRFYNGLGRSLRSLFFSKSLDESLLQRQIDKIRQVRTPDQWVDNAISVQPSRHCSLDLGNQRVLLKEHSLDDEVFSEAMTHTEEQWLTASSNLKEGRETGSQIFLQNSGPQSTKVTATNMTLDSSTHENLDGMKTSVQQSLKRTSTSDSTDSVFDSMLAVEDHQDDTMDVNAFMRYYHVFREDELPSLIADNFSELHVLSICYDHGNWCLIAEKK